MWEERFAKEGYLFGKEPVPFLRRHAGLFEKGQSVLSIAEGEGRNAVHLAKQGLDVTGVEFAPSAVAKAEKLAAENDVSPTFIQSDLFSWEWPQGAFDITMGLFFQFTGPEQRHAGWRAGDDPRLHTRAVEAWHRRTAPRREHVHPCRLCGGL